MRYRSAHAATSGSVPFALRGPKSVRMVLSATVAAAIGLGPVFLGTTPALADTSAGGLTVNNAATTEGGDLTFTLRCAAGPNTCTTDTYTLTTSGGTATGGGVDYAAPTPTPVTFTAAGTKTIMVHTVDDQIYEGTETFTFTATGASGDVATATGTIYDNETMPSYTLTAAAPSVTEAANARTTITATLSARSALTTTITLGTTNGTAVSGTDFDPPVLSSLVIPPGSLTASTTIAITNDGVKDTADTETFTVNGTADNASPRSASATVSIVDAQSTPKLTLTGPTTVAEGDTATYTIHASPASELPITVKWDAVKTTLATGEDDATPGADFQYLNDRTVTVPAGENSATIDLPITSDALNENTEDYAVALSGPTNATLGTTTSVASKITDGDGDLAPTVTIDPQTVTEGNSGKSTKTFTATLSQKSGRTVKVNWATDADTAHAGRDYVSKQGTLVFAPGTLTQTFTVDIIGDTINEGDETFDIDLTNPTLDTSANVSGPAPVVTITDDDALPTVSFDDVAAKEGDAGNALLLPIKLSNASSHDVIFNLTDSTGANSGTADNGTIVLPGSGDYKLLSSTVTIPAGQLVGYAVVLVNGDTVYEADETAYITATVDTISNSDDYIAAANSPKTAKFTLTNDEKAPVLTIDNVTGKEGDTVQVTGSISGTSQAPVYAVVSYAGGSIAGSKAADASDFTNPGPQSFTVPATAAPGATFPISSIALTDDTTNEPAETILVTGISLGAATVTNGSITIAASDGGTTPPPSTTAPTIYAPSMITGAVTAMITGKAGANAPVELWGAPMSSSNAPLVKLADTSASSSGAYYFSRWISTGYTFQVKSGTLSSERKMVKIMQAPVFGASSPSAGKISFWARGNPRGSGQSVTIQRLVKGKWMDQWSGMTASDDFLRRNSIKAAKSSWMLRAKVEGDAAMGIETGYSASVTFTVK